MAAKNILTAVEVRIASLTGKHISGIAKEVYVDMDNSVVGVLPGHQPEFYRFAAAAVTFITPDGKEEKCYAYDGFLEIEQDQVLIAVRDIFRPGEIATEDVEKEIRELEEELRNLPEEEVDKKVKLEREIEKKTYLLRKLSFNR
ncbi:MULTISPECIES: ATP synthase F1 subunit epsilon [unclassified Desulfurobacterium]|uniref:ATP synthase F1 subunit epsilon n=1 Tax=Desulfurobacterium sp. TC5-1 TaxID=1158318 RepID=UPI0003B56AD1|nr:ATP synthase F1 subunit epsilon [Desulfurobacterium sp. TC5-1]